MTTELPFETRRFSVAAERSGVRLDLALRELIPDVSRTRLQELIRDGGVTVDGKIVERPSWPLEEGSVVEVRALPLSRRRRGGPEGEGLRVVYEDEDLAVIDKSPGMVTHPSSVVRGGTVSELAAERWGALPMPQGEDRPGIVHRLDSGTSGLLIVALREEAAVELVRQFAAREVEKTYLAVVHGEPRFDSDWIEAPIGRAPKHPDRMSVRPEGEGRPAETFYRTLHRAKGFGVLSCHPRTGRTHQIRVHLASIDHPLVGDSVYRGRRGLTLKIPPDIPRPSRQALHASALRFRHPLRGEDLSLESEPPEDLQALLRWSGFEGAAGG